MTMCENCEAHRAEVKSELIALLSGDPDSRLAAQVDRFLDMSVTQVIEQRIKPAIERNPEIEMPPANEIRAAVRDCLVASVVALGAASIAQTTPGYTDEGGEPKSIILGQWAGHVMEGEANFLASGMVDNLMNLLGMGSN